MKKMVDFSIAMLVLPEVFFAAIPTGPWFFGFGKRGQVFKPRSHIHRGDVQPTRETQTHAGIVPTDPTWDLVCGKFFGVSCERPKIFKKTGQKKSHQKVDIPMERIG